MNELKLRFDKKIYLSEFDKQIPRLVDYFPNDISVLDGKVLVFGYYNHVGGGHRGAVYWLDKKLHKLCENCD